MLIGVPMKKEIPLFWSDRIAKNIVERKKYNYLDKLFPKVDQLVIKSSTSISGVPHIGNASDIIRHDAVVRSLKDMEKNVKFIWVAEDMDPLRKVPAGIPKEFSKYLGMPVSSIPCPEECCENYVKHFVKLFIDSIHESFGTKPELLTTTDAYRNGEFEPYIRASIEKTDLIREILNKHRTNPLPKVWSPWKPVCDNCGKLITTNVISTDENTVTYKCEDYSFKSFGGEAYTKLEGCGHQADSDIKKGNGKLLWKIEWAAEWPLWKVVFEGAGKEHFMPGGSFWNAGEISEKVFDWPEPHPIKNEIQPYEYIMIDKQKMSASKGNVVATWEWPKFAPPEVLRLLLIKRPSMQRDFSYQRIPNLVDEFDKLKDIYYEKKKVKDEKELNTLKRLYEMCLVQKESRHIPNISFDFAAMITQIIPNAANERFDRVTELLQKTGHITAWDDETKTRVLERLKQAGVWARNYAPEHMRVKLLEQLPDVSKLSNGQQNALKSLGEFLEKNRNDQEIWDEIKSVATKGGLKTSEMFEAAYHILLGKERGPRLVPFIQSLDKEFVVRRFKLQS